MPDEKKIEFTYGKLTPSAKKEFEELIERDSKETKKEDKKLIQEYEKRTRGRTKYKKGGFTRWHGGTVRGAKAQTSGKNFKGIY
tara:strand:- start:84 stop:335 length:252 start_codon:yes stop_codon:yes gene_type:complete